MSRPPAGLVHPRSRNAKPKLTADYLRAALGPRPGLGAARSIHDSRWHNRD
ncbi:MAG TPA: hypothetical protein VNQ31_06665 [Sphingomonadaceae bacterium]|nr:hypothetical protein [Sphingomonadaceae bacterium]